MVFGLRDNAGIHNGFVDIVNNVSKKKQFTKKTVRRKVWLANSFSNLPMSNASI